MVIRSQIYELSLVEIKRFTVKHVLRGHLWDREKVVLKTFHEYLFTLLLTHFDVKLEALILKKVALDSLATALAYNETTGKTQWIIIENEQICTV